MSKIFFPFVLFILLSTIVYSVGGWGEGGWGEGGWGFGTPEPESTPASSSSGGSSGGGSSADFSKSTTMTLNIIKGQKYNLNINGELHKYSVTQIDVENQMTDFIFESEIKVLTLILNQTVWLNYNNDDYDDFEITLIKIYGKNLAVVQIKSVHIFIPQIGLSEEINNSIDELNESNIQEESQELEITQKETSIESEQPQEVPQKPAGHFEIKQLLIIVVVILILAGIFYYLINKEKDEKEDDNNKEGNQRKDKH